MNPSATGSHQRIRLEDKFGLQLHATMVPGTYNQMGGFEALFDWQAVGSKPFAFAAGTQPRQYTDQFGDTWTLIQ